MTRCTYGIYLITNTITGLQYVGQARGRGGIEGRWKAYATMNCKGQRKLYASIREYGWRSHRREILQVVDKDDITGMDEAEMRWIQELNTVFAGLNCTLGGKGMRCDEETRRKIGDAKRADATNLARLVAMNKARAGRQLSDEHVRKIRERSKEVWERPGYRQKMIEKRKGISKGKIKSEQHRMSLSTAKTDHARDARIKADLAMGVAVRQIAAEEGVSAASVYQILDRFKRDGVMVSHMLAASPRPMPVGPWHTIEMFT